MSVNLQFSAERNRKRVRFDRNFKYFCQFCAFVTVVILFVLLGSILLKGVRYLDWEFLTSFASRKPENSGIKAAIVGSLSVLIVCAGTALPLGVATAIFLEEFRPRGRFARRLHGFIELNIRNLAGVPSIVYGIIGLTVFVQFFDIFSNLGPDEFAFSIGDPDSFLFFAFPFKNGVLAGGLTLMLVILPIIIISAQESLRAIPDSLRQGVLAQGATRWQMVWKMTLPNAIPGIMTGAILAISRAIGEAAPILAVAGIVAVRFTPVNLFDEFTVLPLQIYNWVGKPQAEFQEVAASGIIVLLAILLVFNSAAVFIRQKFQKPLQ